MQSGSEMWPKDENGAIVYEQETSICETWQVTIIEHRQWRIQRLELAPPFWTYNFLSKSHFPVH